MKKLKSDDIQLKFDKVCDDVMEGKRRKHALKEHKLTIKKFRELLQDPSNTEKWNTSLKEHAYCLWEKIQDILMRLRHPGRDLSDNSITYARIEEKLLGYAINHSELNACSDACHANATCKEVAEGRADSCVIAAIVKAVREHKTKSGDIMAFVSAEDDSGELENIVIFPDVYEQNKDIIYERATVLISGQVKDKSRNSFIVDKVFSI